MTNPHEIFQDAEKFYNRWIRKITEAPTSENADQLDQEAEELMNYYKNNELAKYLIVSTHFVLYDEYNKLARR